MAWCRVSGRTDVELEPGPRKGTVTCPACGAVLHEESLEVAEDEPRKGG